MSDEYGKWISVKDRLPDVDDYTELIVYGKYYEVTSAFFDNLGFFYYYDDCKERMPDVTHWMPLPEPPKE